MSNNSKEKFISIRARLFLQVGAIILVAILLILTLNNFLLPTIYSRNEMRTMRAVRQQIDLYSFEDEGYSQYIQSLEKEHSFSIDIYSESGEPVYFGTNDMFNSSGKITVSKHKDYDDGSFFEIQTLQRGNIQYIAYGAKLSCGGEIEMYSRKDAIDENANIAIVITSATSVCALLGALIFIYFYTERFTKPLIHMSEVTDKMAHMDFSQKCAVKSNDEISLLSSSINYLSDSLNETLEDLNNKNEQLQKDIEKEKTLEKIRKDFISNVSHELKTPISIIRGYSEGASLMLDSGEVQSAKGYCDIIVNETEKMNTLVLQLLELSMYESGNISTKHESFDIYALIEDYTSGNEKKLNDNGITFINEVAEGTIVSGDIVKTEMIINNYVQNAISHAEGEKIIKLTSENTADGIRIFVFNTGKPIADEDIDKIWISFYRADKSRSRAEGRYGLGLSIVSAIQKLYSLGYGVFNNENGVTFWFDIKKPEQ